MSSLNRLTAALLKKGIWPWASGVESKFPDHYKLRYIERWTRKPIPVHITHEPQYYIDEETKQLSRRQLEDVPIIHCEEQDQGLWGGEGIIKGFIQKDRRKRRVPKIWRPHLTSRIFYSEILDRYMEIVVTHHTLKLIDNVQGFDNYILQTHEVDLKSALGMKLKREMLMNLKDRSLYPDNPEKRDQIYDKYKYFDVLPKEEIEWLGLSLKEARAKQNILDLEAAEAAIKPLKQIYTQDLIARIKAIESGQVADDSVKRGGILSKLFGDDKGKVSS